MAWTDRCPECGTPDFDEIERVDAGEYGPNDPPAVRTTWRCINLHEWVEETPETGAYSPA